MLSLRLYPTYLIFLTAALSLLVTAVLTPLWIRFQQNRAVGQIVRADGPQEHLFKQGTPTMGGVLIIFSVALVYFLMGQVRGYSWQGIMALGLFIAAGLLGFIDDISMVINSRSLGLKARYKIIGTAAIAGVIYYFILKHGFSTSIKYSITGAAIDLKWVYAILLFIIIAGSTNSVNLTDGLDGLAAGTVTIAMLAFAGIAFKQGRLDLALFAAAVGGSCIGFLWYNAYPADIFMGDTGSFALGGAIAAMAIFSKTELLLVLIGGIYVIESMSVILQVFSYRYFKKRLFKMAPIHHHFEMIGWSETKVMIRFWIISGILAGAGFAFYFVIALASKGGP
jgi:phospho-N-acetylmuramoyl-pentapeptide-transferase